MNQEQYTRLAAQMDARIKGWTLAAPAPSDVLVAVAQWQKELGAPVKSAAKGEWMSGRAIDLRPGDGVQLRIRAGAPLQDVGTVRRVREGNGTSCEVITNRGQYTQDRYETVMINRGSKSAKSAEKGGDISAAISQMQRAEDHAPVTTPRDPDGVKSEARTLIMILNRVVEDQSMPMGLLAQVRPIVGALKKASNSGMPVDLADACQLIRHVHRNMVVWQQKNGSGKSAKSADPVGDAAKALGDITDSLVPQGGGFGAIKAVTGTSDLLPALREAAALVRQAGTPEVAERMTTKAAGFAGVKGAAKAKKAIDPGTIANGLINVNHMLDKDSVSNAELQAAVEALQRVAAQAPRGFDRYTRTWIALLRRTTSVKNPDTRYAWVQKMLGDMALISRPMRQTETWPAGVNADKSAQE